MGFVFGAPAIDEQADGDHHSSGKHERNAELASADIVIFRSEILVDLVGEIGGDLRADEESQTEGNVVETGDSGFLIVELAPDSGEIGENQIEDSVDVADVERQNLNNRLCEEQYEGPLESCADMAGETAIWIVEFGV